MELNVNRCSEPSQLKITDIRVTNINGAPKHCPLIKIYTNQVVFYTRGIKKVCIIKAEVRIWETPQLRSV